MSLVSLRAWQNLGDSGGRRATKGASHGVRRARQSHVWQGTQSFFFLFHRKWGVMELFSGMKKHSLI